MPQMCRLIWVGWGLECAKAVTPAHLTARKTPLLGPAFGPKEECSWLRLGGCARFSLTGLAAVRGGEESQ
jgi:hypothetical protein